MRLKPTALHELWGGEVRCGEIATILCAVAKLPRSSPPSFFLPKLWPKARPSQNVAHLLWSMPFTALDLSTTTNNKLRRCAAVKGGITPWAHMVLDVSTTTQQCTPPILQAKRKHQRKPAVWGLHMGMRALANRPEGGGNEQSNETSPRLQGFRVLGLRPDLKVHR